MKQLNRKAIATTGLYSLLSVGAAVAANGKPNIVVLLADDISAREFPIYNSDTWSNRTDGHDSQNVNDRAKTPVMEQLVDQSCVISTCWSATVSMPTRGQLMTGRYAHLTKWWHNGDQGKYKNAEGQQETWPLYESSPYMIGKVAQMGGYATAWSGKTQMSHTDTHIDKYGFDEGLYTPGDLNKTSPYTDFAMTKIPGVKGQKYKIEDSGREVETYMQVSYYWQPSVMAVNTPGTTKKNKMQPWPLTQEERANFGINTYAPDVEQDYLFDFMERKQSEGKPFFIYHTTHLGHDSYNFIAPDAGSKWPATPKVEWTGNKYIRTTPNITGDKGVYEFNNTLSEVGMASHVTYLDYVIWRYLEKFKEMGIEENTVFIITADNATSGYGKGSHVVQRGVHVPFMIYAPCLNITKKGHQDVLANMADILPTIADIVGVEFPADYEVSGESLIPFLTTNKPSHRDWVYSYKSNYQLIRGNTVLRDGVGRWYDVTTYPSDLISFPEIKDWSKATKEQRQERDKLIEQMEKFNLWESAHDGPGGIFSYTSKDQKKAKPTKVKADK